MRIVVTGCNGLVGGPIASKLSHNFDVYCLSKSLPVSMEGNTIEYLNVDLAKEDTAPVIKSINPDVIVHCAAVIPNKPKFSDQEIYAVNSLIDKNVISAAVDLNCHLLYTSSTIVYGFPDNEYDVAETHPLTAISRYAQQKIESEILIKSKVGKHLIFRINAPYGRNMVNKTVLTNFIDLALANKPLLYHGSGSRMQDFTNVEDIASLVNSVIVNDRLVAGLYNISSGHPITMFDLATLIVRLSNSKSEIKASGETDVQENYKASYSLQLAKEVLGWNPQVTISEGIEEIIDTLVK